ncbi:MAG: putative membrane protein YeaQ/YmgE (transglycosylase-associated protein family) [Oleiphilaceae bacterium]|jgi:uncharacterized membrane protein YeaQ/YmgE (transglycosylase-associated protein family)
MHFDIFLMGLFIYLIGFFVCFFLMPKYSEAKPMSFVVGIVLASIGFFLWHYLFDGIEVRTLGNIAERLTVITMAVIYLFGIIAGVVATKFVPEKSSW